MNLIFASSLVTFIEIKIIHCRLHRESSNQTEFSFKYSKTKSTFSCSRKKEKMIIKSHLKNRSTKKRISEEKHVDPS